MTTAPLPTPVARSADSQDGFGLRALRGLSGALAAGLVVLGLVLAGAQWLSGSATVPGPGAGTLLGHGVGGIVALLLQRVADRSRGGRSVAASLAVLAVVGAVLWFWWWR